MDEANEGVEDPELKQGSIGDEVMVEARAIPQGDA
jgi:hypothetical protein